MTDEGYVCLLLRQTVIDDISGYMRRIQDKAGLEPLWTLCDCSKRLKEIASEVCADGNVIPFPRRA
jgi:hypothetical protein